MSIKDEMITFRCSAEEKKNIEKKANGKSIGKYILSCVNNQAEDDFCEQLGNTTIKLHFSMPDQFGTTLTVLGDQYELHAPGERLTDTFLEQLLSYENAESKLINFILFDSNEEVNPVKFTFENESMSIEYNGFQKKYEIDIQEFIIEFKKNVIKYAVYYAAPCNYKAMFFASFDNMVKRLSKYKDDAEKIVKKCNSTI